MKVKVSDYGNLDDLDDYYVTYKVTGLKSDDQKRLQSNVEGKVELKGEEMLITNYFKGKFFPFGSRAASHRIEDFIANEEIEMTVYLTSLLEDEILGE